MADRKGLCVPQLVEPHRNRVLAAMVAFPEAVANGGSFWGGPLVTTEQEWHSTLNRMAHQLCDSGGGFSLPEAAWAVYRLAERGFLMEGTETTNDGESFWWTTPALWEWRRNGCPVESSAGRQAEVTSEQSSVRKPRSDQAFVKQRIRFCCPKRTKTPRDSWPKIYDAYNSQFPKDTTASSGSLRLTHDRHCLKCKNDGR